MDKTKTPAGGANTHERIARRAYEIYTQSGRQPGRCEQNWRQAERELAPEKAPVGYPEQQAMPAPCQTGTEPTPGDDAVTDQRTGRKATGRSGGR